MRKGGKGGRLLTPWLDRLCECHCREEGGGGSGENGDELHCCVCVSVYV